MWRPSMDCSLVEDMNEAGFIVNKFTIVWVTLAETQQDNGGKQEGLKAKKNYTKKN